MSKSKKDPETFFIYFTPGQWGEEYKFSKFFRSTYQFSNKQFLDLHGIGGHYEKYQIFSTMAQQYSP